MSDHQMEPPQPQDVVQQGQQLQQALGQSPGGPIVNAAGENLQCQWRGCGERCTSPEALYEHVCERHVGRKSTNNLNLTCAWGQCNTTTVKRDHITSHIRVHVPLKPHKCEFCGKAFKRPQDLKKHVKTHADDSVIMRSPEPNGGQRQAQGMVYDTKGGSHAHPHYPQELTHLGVGGYYQPAMAPQDYTGQHSGNQYYQPHPQQQAGQHPGYAPVYYPPGPAATQASYHDFETRKRGMDALDQFFGDIKRRQLDPVNYQNVSRRLFELQGLQLPLITQQPISSIPAYQPVAAMGGSYEHADPIQAYSLPPMGNAKTREDLTSIDQILEQMQATIYENDTHLAQAGVPQPGYVAYSTSQTPPSAHLPSTHAHSNLLQHQHHGSIASATDSVHSATPGLTPPSSAHSPMAGHSAPSSAAMYPNLPASTNEQMAYAAANAATLSGMYDTEDNRRRYGGSMLQHAKPAKDERRTGSMDVDRDGSATPPAAALNKQAKGKKKPSPKNSVIDPALSGDAATPGSTKSTGEISKDDAERERDWVQNMRLIEWMREFIKKKLDSGEYDEGRQAAKTEGDTSMGGTDDEHKKDQEQLYPVLQAVTEA